MAFDDGLRRAAPGAVGIDAAAVEAFLDDVGRAGLELHGLMLHRHGHVAAEAWWWPYRADRPRVMHSVAKSVTACAIGLALEERRFALTHKVASFFPRFLPPWVDENLAAMTVKDLLTMRTGHAAETSGALWRGIDSSWIAEFFKIPVIHPPGAMHVYSSAASYMLSAILTATTGETLHDYLKPRLFEPLGITGERWDVGPDGINPGGNGLTCRTADILKLGVLHAQKGLWNGRRLLPEAWVADATRSQGDGGYGYHWVVRDDGSFAALGVFVQMVLVFPQAGATLAIMGAMEQSSRILPLIDRYFPAAFKDGPIAGAAADESLRTRLARTGEAKPMVSGAGVRPDAGGHWYLAEPNEGGITALRCDFAENRCLFRLCDAEGEHQIAAALEGWLEGETDMPGRDLHHGYSLPSARVVAGARWLDEATLEMTWIFVETAFRDTVTLRFEGNRMTHDRRVNVNSAALSQPTVTAYR